MKMFNRIAMSLCVATMFASPAYAACGNGAVFAKTRDILNSSPTADTLVLAHRGFWGTYQFNSTTPENSLEAVARANKYCLDGVEVDVKVSEDGVPYLMHDFNLGRTTNIYTVVRGNMKFDPYSGNGINPTMLSVSAVDIDKLRLLTPNRDSVTDQEVPRITDLLVMIKQTPDWATPVVFDIKNTETLAAVDERTGAGFPLGTSRVYFSAKVNATLFPEPDQYFAISRTINPIPVYTTNMLSKINVDDSMTKWQRSVGTIEVNVKQNNGLLSRNKASLLANSKKVAVFQAIPDANRGDRIFNSNGSCCYRLSDLYFTWTQNGKVVGRDTDDQRGSLPYLVDQGFGLITTDDPVGAVRYLAARGKRRFHVDNYVKQ